MDKLFKKLCVILSIVIVISSISVLTLAGTKGLKVINFDFFQCNDIVKVINNMEMNMTSVVYVQDADGQWVDYSHLHGQENRIWISKSKMPKNLKNAFVAIEDKNFYKHAGVDWRRTGAAFLNWIPNVNILKGDQGGSTLTQQLIKNVTSDNDKNASRKFREIIRALSIERMMDKDTILEAYLNTISLGSGICGVQVAANYYFNKDVSELSLNECACLAAITKSPTKYNPILNPDYNNERRQLVLDLMYEQELISYDDYSKNYDKRVKIDNTQKEKFELPINNYFIDALIDNVCDDLCEKYKCNRDVASSMLFNGGYKIYSTMDMNIQGIMEDVYTSTSRYFPQKRNGKHVQSSMTVMDYEGHIVGIVGGVGKKTVNRSLNRALSAPRQPGSTMKPIGVYAPAIDNGTIYYSSVYEDKPLEKYYPDGKPGPKEWYGYYAGNMSISKAIERSANTIPCHILKEMGVNESFDFLTKKLGMEHLVEQDKNIAALALGGCSYGITSCESAAAYAVFGNGGNYYSPKTYYRIEKSNGDLVLKDGEHHRAIKEETSAIMNKLLQNVVYGSRGTGSGIRNYSKMKAYAKTGTSSESNDLWMVAGTPYYVGSVWYGFDNNGAVYNGGAAAKVWNDVMRRVHNDLEEKEFDKLVDIEPQEYCKYTGKLKGAHCYNCLEGYFVEGQLPEVCDGKHRSSVDSYYSSSSSNSSSQTTSSSSSNTSSTSSSNTSSTTSSSQSQSSLSPTPSSEPQSSSSSASSTEETPATE